MGKYVDWLTARVCALARIWQYYGIMIQQLHFNILGYCKRGERLQLKTWYCEINTPPIWVITVQSEVALIRTLFMSYLYVGLMFMSSCLASETHSVHFCLKALYLSSLTFGPPACTTVKPLLTDLWHRPHFYQILQPLLPFLSGSCTAWMWYHRPFKLLFPKYQSPFIKLFNI